MKKKKNKTYHEKVQDLSSPTIPNFQLNLKNSQSYDHFKKSSKRCAVFFVPYCILKKYTVRDKKIPPLSATFFVLTISLSFLECEWKILYRLKAEILDFFMV